MLGPDQVIHDRARAQLGRVQSYDGETIMRKVSKNVLRNGGLVVVDFLSKLAEQPHPNLLVPLEFSGSVGEPLVEDYPDLTGHERLDAASAMMRGELADRCVSLNRLVDFVVQMCDGVDFMHQNGFIHRDIRRQNIFVKRATSRLIPIVFDYDSVTRPYYMEHSLPQQGIKMVNRETPPEELTGPVMIDGRHDVYQLGWILRELTHREGGLGPWQPVAPLGEKLEEIVAVSTGPIDSRYPTAGELRDQLLAATGEYRGESTLKLPPLPD